MVAQKNQATILFIMLTKKENNIFVSVEEKTLKKKIKNWWETIGIGNRILFIILLQGLILC